MHRDLSVEWSWRVRPRGWRAAALLAVLLLTLMLAACGRGAEDDVAASVPAAEAQAAAPTATVAEATPEPTAAPTEAAATEATVTEEAAEETAPTGDAADAQIFVIDPEQSEARFIINEVLFGNPNTVTGRTNEVTGEISINVAVPAQSTVGEISINARALATDNRFRNRSVNRLILQTNRDEYQFITFTPTTIEGLPESVAVGDTFDFAVTGDLKIRDIVQPTTFEVTVTADSATQISGLAQAVVMRADFELSIPDVDGVADVAEEVRLELEFVAIASE